MKGHKKIMITAASAAICFAVSVPAVTFAAVGDEATGSTYISQWVTDTDGKIYYYNESGTMLTGEQEIDGEYYLFSKNGVLKTGWRTVNGKRRYYDHKTGKAVYGKIEECGDKFYVEPENGKITDSVYTDDKGYKYITDKKGAVIDEQGFVTKDDSVYYVTADGSLASGKIIIDKAPYVFGTDCKEMVGWVDVDGKEYYYDTVSGEIKLGFFNIGNDCYYVDVENGKKEGVTEIDGVEYFFAEETGKLQTGLLEINGNIKYFYPNGKYASGVTEINGKSYIFDEKGNRMTGLCTYEDKLYYTDEQGVLNKGLAEIDEVKYFFSDDYTAYSGILEIDGNEIRKDVDYTEKIEMEAPVPEFPAAIPSAEEPAEPSAN